MLYLEAAYPYYDICNKMIALNFGFKFHLTMAKIRSFWGICFIIRMVQFPFLFIPIYYLKMLYTFTITKTNGCPKKAL